MNLAPRARSHAGFTLLEVMITVAIVGILAAIALPWYNDFVMRGKIIDGTMKLGDRRAQMEKFFLDNRTYVGGCAATVPATSGADTFTYACADGATTYTLTATGDPAKGMLDFEYTVTQTGAKATTKLPGSWGTPAANCWSVRKDGTCQ